MPVAMLKVLKGAGGVVEVDGALGMGGQSQVLQQGGGDSSRVGLLGAPCLVSAAAAVQHPGVQSGGREGRGHGGRAPP